MVGFRPASRLVGATALATLLAVGLAMFAAERSAEATGPGLVRLTDVQTDLTHFGSAGVGSGYVTRLRLFGSRSTSRPIGHGVVTCMNVGAGERACSGSYMLPKGTLETSGVLKTRLFYTQAVVGGTGDYDDARGTLTVTARSVTPRREILLFRLTG